VAARYSKNIRVFCETGGHRGPPLQLLVTALKTFEARCSTLLRIQSSIPGEESNDPLSCLSQKAFYSLRREFIQQLTLPRRQFVLEAKLKEILPEDDSDEVWKNIGLSLRVKKWPALSRTRWPGFFTPRVENVRESFPNDFGSHRLTRSLPLPVLTVSKCDSYFLAKPFRWDLVRMS
jgi:hypothetical protein